MKKDTVFYSDNLRKFYNDNGISVGSFCCPNLDSCLKASYPRPLHNGAEAHIGSCYGESLRIVIVSLDTGHKSSDMNDRRSGIESVVWDTANPHMKGTITLIKTLLNGLIIEPANIHKYYAMVNSAKCSGADGSRDKVNSKLYGNCHKYTIQEISLLEPQLIITQGVDAANTFKREAIDTNSLSPIFKVLGIDKVSAGWLTSLVHEYVKLVDIGSGNKIPLLQTPHPSSRNGQWGLFRRIALEPLVKIIHTLINYQKLYPIKTSYT